LLSLGGKTDFWLISSKMIKKSSDLGNARSWQLLLSKTLASGLVLNSLVLLSSQAQAQVSCQCTNYVANRLSLSSNFPNAYQWNDGYLQNQGFQQTTVQPGAIVVMEPMFPGADSTNGHVGVVEEVLADGRIKVRGANQYGSSQFTESGCSNVSIVQFGTSVNGRSDISFWARNNTSINNNINNTDIDGDGRADAIVVNDSNVTVRRSTGSGFGSNESWIANSYYGQRGTFFADVDGDKRADAIVVNDSNVTVRRSTGSGFGGNENWTADPYFGQRGTFFADVNGDGRADAIVVNNSNVTVRRSTGSGFGGNENWTADPYFGQRGTFLGLY
jgi:hypothetical protein